MTSEFASLTKFLDKRMAEIEDGLDMFNRGDREKRVQSHFLRLPLVFRQNRKCRDLVMSVAKWGVPKSRLLFSVAEASLLTDKSLYILNRYIIRGEFNIVYAGGKPHIYFEELEKWFKKNKGNRYSDYPIGAISALYWFE